jgi:dihydroneopterin aldolase
MDTILIEGLEFYGFHGVPDAEQTIGHRYLVDLRFKIDTRKAALTDRVADTVDYADVAAVLLDVGREERFRLIEALAQRMADALLMRFPSIVSVALRLRKPLPPMNAIAAAVGIEIVRSRDIDHPAGAPLGEPVTFASDQT